MSDTRPLINPRRRDLEFNRLAVAILEAATLVDDDEKDLALGAAIYARIAVPKEKSA